MVFNVELGYFNGWATKAYNQPTIFQHWLPNRTTGCQKQCEAFISVCSSHQSLFVEVNKESDVCIRMSDAL